MKILDCVLIKLLLVNQQDNRLQYTSKLKKTCLLLETFIMRLNCRKYGDKAYSERCKPQHCKGKVEQCGDTKHLRLDNSCIITFDHFESYYNCNYYSY